MDFEKIAAEFADEISAGPIPEPAAEKVERAGRCLAMNGWNPNVAGEADFTAASSEWARCTCVPRKGLFIYGSFGCGKTMLMEAIRRTVGGLWVNLANPDEAERLDAKVWPNWNADAMRRTVFLDDLGAESAASEYGIRRELAGEFITAYHRMGEGRLYVTTNLSGEEMVERYSSRVCSRLKELCIPLHLTGADKRKWENGAKHINSDGFKKAPLPLRWRGFAQSASELSCAPLKRRNGNGAILEASEFDCAEGGGK